MIFGEKFRRKYALSEAGGANVKKGTFWTVVTSHKNRESGGRALQCYKRHVPPFWLQPRWPPAGQAPSLR